MFDPIEYSMCMCSVVSNSVNPWTTHQNPLSVEFSKQEYWNGLPFPTSGHLPDPGIKHMSPTSPALAGILFTIEPPGKPYGYGKTTTR